MKTASLALAEKYTAPSGRLYMTGTQALIRLLITQKRRDAAAGLNTAGFLSGYRGSPLGSVDIQAFQAKAHLEANGIVFRPGINEEAAATAIWGTQQVGLFPGATTDGVFAMWYGKGPGLDRSGDALKHANHAGSARHGGVLVVAGDDHASKSSTIPNQSEQAFVAASIPVLYPADLQDILDLGLHGFALSRHSGLYAGFKMVAEVVDSSGSVETHPERLSIILPDQPEGLVGIRIADTPLEQEHRVQAFGLPAAKAYARANGLDRIVLDSPDARLGIVTAGKSFLDVRQALEDFGIDEATARAAGIRVLKLAMTWPIEDSIIRRFAQGLEEILVVEEKQPFIEAQVKAILFDAGLRVRVLGKHDESGDWLLKPTADLSAAEVEIAIGSRLARFHPREEIAARLNFLQRQEQALARVGSIAERKPYFCSGCPHNTSTKVIEGSRALAGIGCHYMARWMDRNTDVFAQMGGEGIAWIGQAPFTGTKHVFANLGDGTYHHSGILAVRAAVAAGVNITYKILFNDAVAMTGGQHIDGPLTVPQITRQLAAENVATIAVVSDEPEKYEAQAGFAPGVRIAHRRELPRIEREMRDTAGTTAIVYDQTCASEKRRRRKRGTMADPPKRAFINSRVCEGCGDCSKTSNCLSVVPVETEYGRKRAIDQSSCNKDFSCIDGFCPSFVTVHGNSLRKPPARTPEAFANLPEPALPALDRAHNILVTGIGGTGVVTIGALLGAAAHLEGKSVTVLDMLGMAQKGGGVWSHIRIAARPGQLAALRISRGGADLLLACDIVVGAGQDALGTIGTGRTRAVVNTHPVITGDFVHDPNSDLPIRRMLNAINDAAGTANVHSLDATALATALLGDSIATNLFMLGYAWQQGLVPLAEASILRAIELNGQAVAMNQAAFHWGRAAAANVAAVSATAFPASAPAPRDLDALIADRTGDLTGYQNIAYAARYRRLVDAARAREQAAVPGRTDLAEAVARNFYKLMAYKDEYEVARLFAAPAFRAELEAQFEGKPKLTFHLAPPILGGRDKITGHPRKRAFGAWMMPAFRLLAPLRVLRGTAIDPFGRTAERRAERALIVEYETLLARVLTSLTPQNHAEAVALAALPDRIRGYGHVKEQTIAAARAEQQRLLAAFAAPLPQSLAAE